MDLDTILDLCDDLVSVAEMMADEDQEQPIYMGDFIW